MATVLVTGGGSGIGLATVRRFHAVGHTVVALALDFPDGVLDDLPDVQRVAFDLSNIGGIPALVARLPPVDVLVNNAGVMRSAPWDAYPDRDKTLTLAVNLEAPIALIGAIAPGMATRGGGRIVNNTSIAAHIGHPDIWYGATKAGLLNATKSFATALGPDGIVVNAIAAGPVNTGMLASIPQPRKDAIAASAITGRFAEPTEVADIIYWLGVECPEYVNGVCIDINNGAFMR